jgi:AraC-like DNA-binding protein
MPDTHESLHEFIRAHRPAEGQGYSPAVRSRVVRYVRSRRAAGLTWTALSQEVGLSTTTLSNWCRDAHDTPLPQEPAFLPVHISTAPTPPPPAPAPVQLSLTSPNGWRVDGLDLASLAQLLPVLS